MKGTKIFKFTFYLQDMRQIDALKSPRFTQVSTFGRLPLLQDLHDVKAFFVGIPFDDATTYRPGARFGRWG
nr:hypothetical protein [Sulfuracidifex tepidarius]